MIAMLVLGLVIGCVIGRAYGWMKYHFPESQELIQLKITKTREERLTHEVNLERMRKELDEILRERQCD